jgi:phenylpropionate dioxygenase-like ring-hydroxylating dioxygenase large terminal subunit
MLLNHWYIACPAIRLPRGKPVAARVLDRDLVVFRDAGGAARALVDRCPHRGVPLSLGRVHDGTLACGYHGWRFDGAGACVHIPSLTEGQRIPAGCDVPTLACVERDGYVWVWMGEGAPVPEEPPAIQRFDAHRWLQGTVAMKCHWMRGVENNLDWCHPVFAHPWTHAQFFIVRFGGFRAVRYETRVTERGMVVFTPPTESEDVPIPDAPMVRLEYELPDRLTVLATKGIESRVVIHVVPTGPDTCRLEWIFPRAVPFGPRVRWTDHEPRILAQDRILLEGAEARASADALERSVEADWSTLLLRRVVALAERGEWPEGRSSLPARRVVEVRS